MNKSGHTAFDDACQMGHTDIVKHMLHFAREEEVFTGLQQACLFGRHETVQLLWKNNLREKINQGNRDGNTLLHLQVWVIILQVWVIMRKLLNFYLMVLWQEEQTLHSLIVMAILL